MPFRLPSGVTWDEVYMALKADYRDRRLGLKKPRRQYLPSWVRAAMIALLSGRRRKEIYMLDWSHVSFHHGVIRRHIAKKRGSYMAMIPMGKEFYKVLRTMWIRDGRPMTGPVVPRKSHGSDRHGYQSVTNSWSKYFHTWAKAHGWDIRFHDLRHLFALHLLSHGAPLSSVRLALQHANPSVTLMYLEQAPEDLARWLP